MKRVIRVGLALVAVLLLAVGAIAGYGATQPRDHVASMTVDLDRPLPEVRSILENVQDYPRWRTGVTRVETLDGGRFVEYQGGDAIRYRFEEQNEARIVVRIDDPDLPFGGTWTHELVAVGTGSRLTTTERGFVSNVFVRGLASLLMDPTDTIEQFHADLVSETS